MSSKIIVSKSQKYSESIINTIREPLIILDQDLRVVTVSSSFYDFFKVNPEETVGQPIYDLGNKQWDIPKLRELLEDILPQKATFDDYEVEHDFPGIGKRTLLLNARRIPNPPGKIEAILLAMEDITKRKSTEESYLSLAAIVNTSLDGIIGKTLQGDIVSWNKGAEKIYGYTEKEMQGKNISLLIPDGYKDEMLDQLKKLRAGEFIKNHETKRVRKDGVVIDISLTLSTIKDKLGNICGMSAIMHDITEQKRAKQLQTVSEYSESIINTIREPLIVIDQGLRVVSASRAFYEVFKVNPEETVGQLIYDLGNKQWDIPKLRELLEDILPKKVSFDNYEVEHNFSTIGRRIMLLNARQIQRASGKERIILLAIEDITERREIENGLEKAHEELTELATELKRTSRAKSEFLANMSHELRTPLNSINGFSEVLYDETFGPLNEKQKKYVNNVLTSGKHLLLLINQILDMAKVEAGKMKLALSSLPMKNLLNEISLLVADMISKKKIEMLLEIDENLPDIEADELKVKEIIYNLLSNAAKFTPEGGKIGMRAKQDDAGIEIVVWDTGVGIAPENMEKIFEGFFRVDTPYSRVTEGTGLGLPLSKKLVELHGGKLYVESGGLGKGTSVRFALPIISSKVV
jgi:two-component system CheB/CheR fusion protein